MKPIPGIHHITAIASDPQANLDFYQKILGQRLVKTTVNFDDPGTYHLYYGDEVGSPGTILTFFPWPHARRGVVGNGEIGATAYTIGPNSLDYWRDRLAAHGVHLGDLETRFGLEVLPLRDPDGMLLELVVGDDDAPAAQFWADGPVPEEHALRGFHGLTLFENDAEATCDMLARSMGYRLVGQEDRRWRLQADSGALAATVDLLERPGISFGRMGAGSVHHVAFRVPDDSEQIAYQQSLRSHGFDVTPVRDRQYFHSIYWREPGGVLFEIATDPPGFTWDEAVGELGTGLRLPPWLEDRRSDLSRVLPQLQR